MSDSFTLPLRPLVEKADVKDTLPVRIAQINAQRGSFRNVTEQSLQAEIDARQGKGEAPEDQYEGKEPADVDATERLEQLYKRRAEITQFAMQAHMESMFALDFISLLLSKHMPRQAETSISAFLKQTVPMGSLNTDVIKTPQRSESAKKDTKTVSRGWKLESFNAAANKLLKSASRLEEEVAAETKYWGEVLAVKDKGWKVCRVPREKQVLGVQYGFLEATPAFRDRGLAALRRADDGRLILDKGIVPSRPRAVRVRVKQDDRITGCFKPSQPAAVGDDSIESRILQARDTLYEEELFYELTREARVMASLGVTTQHNLVQFEISEGQEIMFDLVDLEELSDQPDPETWTHEHDLLAEAVAHAMRILLSYAHRQNLRRRTQIPPPLTPKKRPVPEYPLLRPIAAYLQHSSHVRSLESFLNDIYRTLKSAGLESSYTANPFASVNLSRERKPAPVVERLVEEFLSPLESTFSGTIATPGSSLGIKIRTHLMPPSLGTDYEFSISLPPSLNVQPPARLGLKEEVERFVTHMMTLDLTTFIPSILPKSQTAPKDNAPGEQLEWEVAFPHYGEMHASSPSTGRIKKMTLSLSRREMSLRTSWLDEFREPDEANQTGQAVGQVLYTWKADDVSPDGTRTAGKTLADVVAEASRDETPSS
ncbi:hypothetical protein VTN02DRAFT_514 [Thermoascus thermophilus]